MLRRSPTPEPDVYSALQRRERLLPAARRRWPRRRSTPTSTIVSSAPTERSEPAPAASRCRRRSGRPPSSGPARRRRRSTPASRPEARCTPARASSPSSPRAGAERAQDRGLVDALELGHRDGADQDQDAARAARSPPTIEMASVTLSSTRLDRREDLTHVDRRDVRKLRDQIALERGRAPSDPPAPAGCRCNVCGARSSGPGRNTNMKPPFRASSHLTSRTLVTRASIVAAERRRSAC